MAEKQEENLKIRAVIEVAGKPKEHVEESIREYIDSIKEQDVFELLEKDIAEPEEKEAETEESPEIKKAWATFAEVEIEIEELEGLSYFCINYMPSSIEIIEPEEITYTNRDLTKFFNDLQAQLHDLDMLAKRLRTQVKSLRKNSSGLLRNFIKVILKGRSLTSKQISEITGVTQEKAEDFLDKMIDEDKVKMEGDQYSLK